MRLIDADALIEQFNSIESGTIGVGYAVFTTGQMPTIEPSGWIPCAERLPESGLRVVVTVCDEITIAAREREFGDDESTPIHWYDDEGLRFNDDTVTAWQPLPEPWRGDHIRESTKMI